MMEKEDHNLKVKVQLLVKTVHRLQAVRVDRLQRLLKLQSKGNLKVKKKKRSSSEVGV
jgi:hypothetical protein